MDLDLKDLVLLPNKRSLLPADIDFPFFVIELFI